MRGNREIKSRNQSEYVTKKRQKKNEGSFFSHALFNFVACSCEARTHSMTDQNPLKRSDLDDSLIVILVGRDRRARRRRRTAQQSVPTNCRDTSEKKVIASRASSYVELTKRDRQSSRTRGRFRQHASRVRSQPRRSGSRLRHFAKNRSSAGSVTPLTNFVAIVVVSCLFWLVP